MIQYINKIPSKIEYFDMVRTAYEDENIEVSELSRELDETITAVCVYNGDRMVGMGRVKKEDKLLCIEDLIVKLEPLKEEIQNNIIVNLIDQVNKMKKYDVTVRDCLNPQTDEEMYQSNEDQFDDETLSNNIVRSII